MLNIEKIMKDMLEPESEPLEEEIPFGRHLISGSSR